MVSAAVENPKFTTFFFSKLGTDSFGLSDATSLLMRLQLEDAPKGLDLKDRWREIAILYDGILDDTMTQHLFYDLHALLGCLYGARE